MGKSALVFLTCILGAALAIDCNCPFNYDPVCGTNGITYDNICNLRCAANRLNNLKFLKYGVCKPKEELCICNDIAAPVCGSNGITYDNQCEFECEVRNTQNFHLKIEYDGECSKLQYKVSEIEDCVCPAVYSPTCGSNRVTYANSCLLKCDAKKTNNLHLKVKHNGECTIKEQCRCTKMYNPVCGSDDVTYDNECTLNCANAKKHSNDVFVKYHGICKVKEDICMCNKMNYPVCGNDGVTYNNKCEFQCEVKKSNKYNLKIDYVGECDTKLYNTVAVCRCPYLYFPVCASNGKTYDNKCLFDCFVSQSHADVRIVKTGNC